jgi:hypothetical protein
MSGEDEQTARWIVEQAVILAASKKRPQKLNDYAFIIHEALLRARVAIREADKASQRTSAWEIKS